jgi:pilus assembly protein CpaF
MTIPADAERIRDKVRERLLTDADGERLDRASAPVRRLRVREVALRILREEHAILSASALTQLVNQVSDEVVGLGPIERLLRDPEVTEGLLTMWVPECAGSLPTGRGPIARAASRVR